MQFDEENATVRAERRVARSGQVAKVSMTRKRRSRIVASKARSVARVAIVMARASDDFAAGPASNAMRPRRVALRLHCRDRQERATTPFAFAACVAMRSMIAGDRQS